MTRTFLKEKRKFNYWTLGLLLLTMVIMAMQYVILL